MSSGEALSVINYHDDVIVISSGLFQCWLVDKFIIEGEFERCRYLPALDLTSVEITRDVIRVALWEV